MIVPLTAPGDLDAALAAPLAVVYKHSPRCGVCIAAEREVRHFARGHPDVPVYWLDVVAHQGLALEVASRRGWQWSKLSTPLPDADMLED